MPVHHIGIASVTYVQYLFIFTLHQSICIALKSVLAKTLLDPSTPAVKFAVAIKIRNRDDLSRDEVINEAAKLAAADRHTVGRLY